jgi:hypothetical protein
MELMYILRAGSYMLICEYENVQEHARKFSVMLGTFVIAYGTFIILLRQR